MVIPCHRQHATITRRAKSVRVFDDVHTSVNARAFAIPHSKNAIEARALEQVGLLAAPHRCRSKVFINTWLEVDLMGIEILGGFPHGLIETAQWAATITRDEAGSVQAPLQVPFSLQHWKANQRLNACHVRRCVVVSVLVVQ